MTFRKCIVSLFLSLCQFLHSQITEPAKTSFPFLGIEVGSQLVPGENYQYNHVEYDGYFLQLAEFNFRSPALTAGYLYRGKHFFFKSGISYWMGIKRVYYTDSYSSTTPFRQKQTGQFTATYYQVDQEFNGSVTFHYADPYIFVGKTLGRNLSLVAGCKNNILVYRSIKGALFQQIDKYHVSQNNRMYLGRTESRYRNNEIKGKDGQVFENLFFLCFGLNSVFVAGERDCYIQLDYDYSISYNMQMMQKAGINLKAGMSLRKKKKKEASVQT